MISQQSTTAQYQVIGINPQGKDVWASFNNYIQASNHAIALTKELEGISFFVKDLKPPTDEEVQEWFSHLDFGEV